MLRGESPPAIDDSRITDIFDAFNSKQWTNSCSVERGKIVTHLIGKFLIAIKAFPCNIVGFKDCSKYNHVVAFFDSRTPIMNFKFTERVECDSFIVY